MLYLYLEIPIKMIEKEGKMSCHTTTDKANHANKVQLEKKESSEKKCEGKKCSIILFFISLRVDNFIFFRRFLLVSS